MKTLTVLLSLTLLGATRTPTTTTSAPAVPVDPMAKAIEKYFDGLFAGMKKVADKDPDVDTFRDAMRPLAESTEGFYGGTLIDPDFVIRQVYYRSHFLARGYDLKKVPELGSFYQLMKKSPSPQLSEPGHGSLLQPRLIAMRYPVIKDKKLKNIISMMVRTDAFLTAVGLDRCAAFRITCGGKAAEENGTLTPAAKKITVKLPANEWVVEYEKARP